MIDDVGRTFTDEDGVEYELAEDGVWRPSSVLRAGRAATRSPVLRVVEPLYLCWFVGACAFLLWRGSEFVNDDSITANALAFYVVFGLPLYVWLIARFVRRFLR